jgi:hypothetical protein
MSLKTIKERDALPWERCQFPVPSLVRGDPPRPCRKPRDNHGINYGYRHPFTYDPATDVSAEADRRALLRVAEAAADWLHEEDSFSPYDDSDAQAAVRAIEGAKAIIRAALAELEALP